MEVGRAVCFGQRMEDQGAFDFVFYLMWISLCASGPLM